MRVWARVNLPLTAVICSGVFPSCVCHNTHLHITLVNSTNQLFDFTHNRSIKPFFKCTKLWLSNKKIANISPAISGYCLYKHHAASTNGAVSTPSGDKTVNQEIQLETFWAILKQNENSAGTNATISRNEQQRTTTNELTRNQQFTN